MKIDPETKVFGVIGYPLSHSLSPIMHNRAFKEKNINAIYLYFPCRDIKGVIPGMKSLSIKGLSVTIPHKEAICSHIDEMDPLAEEIGAVNTLLNKDARIIGYNTDAYGAMAALKKEIAVKNKNVLVIGAGGASRAICFALKREKANIIIANRTETKGKALAKEVEAEFCPLSRLPEKGIDILIQTTPVGMYPDSEKSPVPEHILRADMVVMDIVYNPLETKLLRIAKEKGCKVIRGLEMFVHQGAKQFELWTGEKAPIDVMRNTVISFLRGKRI